MKFLILSLAVLACSIHSIQSVSPDDFDAGKTYEACAAETKPPEEDIQRLQKKELPQTKEGKCLLKCMMEKMGVLVNKKIDIALSAAYSNHFQPDASDEKKKIIKEVLEECDKEVTPKFTDDNCENASIFTQCTNTKGKEKGLKDD